MNRIRGVGRWSFLGTAVLLAALALAGCSADSDEEAPAAGNVEASAAQAPAASTSTGAQWSTAPSVTPTAPEPTAQAAVSPSPSEATQTAAADDAPKTPQRLMTALLSQALVGEVKAIREMGETGDPSYIPVLLELARFQFRLDAIVGTTVYQSLEQILEAYQGPQPIWEDRWWNWWLEWLGQHPEVTGPPGYAEFKGKLYTRLFNEEVGSFFYEGVKTRIRLEEVVWGGVDEAGIPALTNAPVIPADQAEYLAPGDRVFGVSINGEHRAYPHRVMNLHEMANDVLGGVPIALAY